MSKRVVVTGFGVITPFGYGPEVIKENAFQGIHGFKPISSFDTSTAVAKRGGEAPVSPRSYRSFAKYCTEQALAMAGLDVTRDAEVLRQAAVAVGNLGEGAILREFYEQFQPVLQTSPADGTAAAEATASRKTFATADGEMLPIHDANPFAHAEAIAEYIGSEGPQLAFTNACIASANAIGYGFDQISKGRVDCALVGGLNVLHPQVFFNFDSSRAMADDVVRPFSEGRTGLLIGDGAAILVLESLESAERRGATVLAEMLGWGVSSDGFHVSQPEPNGNGLARSMRMALRKSGCAIEEIDYINAHGTGTPLNDRSETKAYKQVFGDHASVVPISSTKSVTGHMLEATGGVEAVISILALLEQTIPPTANYLGPEDELDLDYVVDGARRQRLRTVMSNSSAFGGNNCTLLFRREEA
ncbi:beta-ketoacyl-[acyl-carrier-protein] synthase family protein [Paenibacillus athensensis]|uniref:Beta-ketoacyl-ACP reductase n=1 Tax=Paenibacillus athensensis TaxID=1967502 RepID=A0A4Y8Q579_9BACL|nr:beta-ketoacyl-[acyl-carrier-protein] synthase family protein [Paenibacillus athensensis]MCD1259617.1 beta-ketoacyl-[acyl-carrier-protein] synthase family protein [Paenibacillus athensensis]